MKHVAALVPAVLVLVLAPAASALAGPMPSPEAPAHTGTACASVLLNNPQAGDAPHSAVPAQVNLAAVGAAFCGL